MKSTRIETLESFTLKKRENSLKGLYGRLKKKLIAARASLKEQEEAFEALNVDSCRVEEQFQSEIRFYNTKFSSKYSQIKRCVAQYHSLIAELRSFRSMGKVCNGLRLTSRRYNFVSTDYRKSRRFA
jgi:hypothetical protein